METTALPTNQMVKAGHGYLDLSIDMRMVLVAIVMVLAGVVVLDLARYSYYVYLAISTEKFHWYTWTVIKAMAEAWKLSTKYRRLSPEG